jgi:hypothetical protein
MLEASLFTIASFGMEAPYSRVHAGHAKTWLTRREKQFNSFQHPFCLFSS